jgi:hypothetical protein
MKDPKFQEKLAQQNAQLAALFDEILEAGEPKRLFFPSAKAAMAYRFRIYRWRNKLGNDNGVYQMMVVSIEGSTLTIEPPPVIYTEDGEIFQPWQEAQPRTQSRAAEILASLTDEERAQIEADKSIVIDTEAQEREERAARVRRNQEIMRQASRPKTPIEGDKQ